MFEKFKDYMFYLLHYPIKDKQLYILFTVLGGIADEIKDKALEIRKQTSVLTATNKSLDMCGKDRNMPRLRYEDDESYRRRLLLKFDISVMAGTEQGLLMTLQGLGYDKSWIEPFYLIDKSRWAEFIIYLAAEKDSAVTDLAIIDDEIMKVKQASSKPSYALPEYSSLQIKSQYDGTLFKYIYCNTIASGEHPMYLNNNGYQFKADYSLQAKVAMADFPLPLCGAIVTSIKTYEDYQYSIGSSIKSIGYLDGKSDTNIFEYPLCNQMVSREHPEGVE